jgi:hypothetical protein
LVAEALGASFGRRIEMDFSRALLDQFQIEIGVLKTLNHPNIIHLEDVYEDDDCIYMVGALLGSTPFGWRITRS